jgi:hypothetical protein
MTIMRSIRLCGFVCAVLAGSTAFGQSWAAKMFPVKQHNFGTVARSAKTVFEFPIENTTGRDVHIVSVRTSCGCTNPSIKDDRYSLKPGEKGAVVAAFNTASFSGSRGATLTVTIDQPYWTEVQLNVTGYIRSDVMLQPGSVQFGSVSEGTAAEKLMTITIPGRGDTRITGVRSNNPLLTATVTPAARGQSGYQLKVRLADNAPAGYVREHLSLITNDRREAPIPVLVEGRVTAALTVSPSWLVLGTVEPGQKVVKQIVVQGKQPFTVKRIAPAGEGLSFDLSAAQQPKTVHVIPVTFTAGVKAGKLLRTLQVETDLDGIAGEFRAQATVEGPEVMLVQHNEPGKTTSTTAAAEPKPQFSNPPAGRANRDPAPQRPLIGRLLGRQ